MRKVILLCCMFYCAALMAVNVQVGFSCYNHLIKSFLDDGDCTTHTHPWQSLTNTICGIGGGSHFNEWNSSYGVGLYDRVEDSGGTSLSCGVIVCWEDPNNSMNVRIYSGSENTSYNTTFIIDDVVHVPTFGWVYAPYIDRRHEFGVFTIRGDPTSLVVNDTGKDRVVNGVTIKAGQGARLPFPFWLKMEKIENIKFYDLSTGEEFTGKDFGGYFETGVYYKNGAYAPMWTGDFRFTDGTTEEKRAPIEPLVFGDMKSSNADKLLYANNNALIYADGKLLATNINLVTWWDFNHDLWGGSPVAMINGNVVCSGHSTTHIIGYSVSTEGMKVYGGKGYVDFTMTQTPQSGYSGGACTMRCWGTDYGSSTSGYSNAPDKHRAEVSAGLGVAKFRLTIDVLTGEWDVRAL